MASLFTGGSSTVIPQTPVTEEDPAVIEAAKREAERLRNRRGRASTILTGGMGLLGQPQLTKQKLGE